MKLLPSVLWIHGVSEPSTPLVPSACEVKGWLNAPGLAQFTKAERAKFLKEIDEGLAVSQCSRSSDRIPFDSRVASVWILAKISLGYSPRVGLDDRKGQLWIFPPESPRGWQDVPPAEVLTIFEIWTELEPDSGVALFYPPPAQHSTPRATACFKESCVLDALRAASESESVRAFLESGDAR